MEKSKTLSAYEAAKKRSEAWLPEIDVEDESVISHAWAEIGSASSNDIRKKEKHKKAASNKRSSFAVK